jgi:hypothetical protein
VHLAACAVFLSTHFTPKAENEYKYPVHLLSVITSRNLVIQDYNQEHTMFVLVSQATPENPNVARLGDLLVLQRKKIQNLDERIRFFFENPKQFNQHYKNLPNPLR